MSDKTPSPAVPEGPSSTTRDSEMDQTSNATETVEATLPEAQKPKPSPQVNIDDVAPQRAHNANDLLHAVAALVLAVVVIVFATYMHGITTGVEHDAKTAGQAFAWLMDLPVSILQQFLSFAIIISVLIHLLINREWFQSAVSVVALFCGYTSILVLSFILAHLGVPALMDAVRSSEGAGPAMLPDFYAGIGAFLTVAGPKRSRSSVKWSWNALFIAAAVFVIVSWHSVAGTIVSFAVGRIIGLILRFAMGTRTQGLWGSGIVQAVGNIGLRLTELHRREDDNEPGALKSRLDDDLIENSRIYDAKDERGERYIISVLDSLPHAAGYLNQLWQGLRFTGVAIRRDRSASDAIHHHFSMLLGLKSCGLTTLNPYGVMDSEESSLLVLDVANSPSPGNLDNLNEETMVDYMDYLAKANSRGYTHRHITPDTLAEIHGEHVIVGWQNGDYASGSTNIAMDKVQLLVLLATLSNPQLAIESALKVWDRQTLISLAPFIQKVAIPSATRNLAGWSKQLLGEVRDGLNALDPHDEVEAAEPVTLARFNVKSFLSITLLIIAVAVIFTQLRPNEVINAVRHANLVWALVCLLLSMLAWVGSSITLGSFMDHGKLHPFDLFCSQAASGFTAVSMPAGVGPAFVNLQFLRKNGYKNTAATAIMSVTWAVQGLTTIILLLVMGLFTGRNMFSGMVPTNTLVVVIGAIVLLLCLCMAITPIRRMIVDKYLPILRSYAHQLVEVLTQPQRLAVGIVGALVLNIATGLGFWAALKAFGTTFNPLETIFVFLLANTLGSAMPTPGGLGAVEAALTFAFTSVGVPPAVALSATLLYRVGFYWLRIPIGFLAMKRLDHHNLL